MCRYIHSFFRILFLTLFVTIQSCDDPYDYGDGSHGDSVPVEEDIVEDEESPTPTDTENPTFLALGDSYTIGEGVPTDQRWPVQLVTQINNEGYDLSDAAIIARTGWTTVNLWSSIDYTELSDSTYTFVSLLIGVNDQYRGFNIDDYPDSFRQLLIKAIQLAAGNAENVFVLSIPDWGVTPFAGSRDRQRISDAIDEYNLINRSIAEDLKVQYFNVTDISRQASTDETLLASDGLHPSGKMYALWVEEIRPWMIDRLESMEE